MLTCDFSCALGLLAQEPPPPAPSPTAEGVSGVDGTLVGAGVAGAAVGGVLTDVVLGAAGVSLTGELLTDAAVVGAVGLGGAAAYAATRPDEAGEVTRSAEHDLAHKRLPLLAYPTCL